jgi:hypothetical protein
MKVADMTAAAINHGLKLGAHDPDVGAFAV